MHIVTDTIPSKTKKRAYSLTKQFAISLRHALTGGGNRQSFGEPYHVPEHHRMTLEQLDKFARRQWEAVLSYMVGDAAAALQGDVVVLKKGVKQLLQAGHLVEIHGGNADITKEGFAFVLQNTNTQVWDILILYVNSAKMKGWNSVEVLSFIFQLSSLELGQAYKKESLSEDQQKMLSDLADFGIVFMDDSTSDHFYPTRLATSLTSDAADSNMTSAINTSLSASTTGNGVQSGSGSGYIIIETNYRIYAYTSSPLQIALLSLFCSLSHRFPNMVSGKLTRHSVRRAVETGITAEQIVSFLAAHAHPQMRKNNAANMQARQNPLQQSVIPANVIDQVKLWQLERDRIQATEGFFFKDFADNAEYEETCRFADEIGVLVWKNDRKRTFFVTRHEQIAGFLRSRKRQG